MEAAAVAGEATADSVVVVGERLVVPAELWAVSAEPIPVPAEPVAAPTAPVAAVVPTETHVEQDDRLSTAVALNYCRAAFHQIRKSPTKATLVQQQEQILNNLNLDGVNDPEVIRLYTSVLEEISAIGIHDRERHLLHDQYRRSVTQKVTWDVLAFSTQIATAQFASAVRTGADSWWDYRNKTNGRDHELLKVERQEMSQLVEKSSLFLDTFWKLAQKKDIPDRWLVRGEDLDRLDSAMREPNLDVRLRILQRLEPFMEAYPPYWYYLARTQQARGDLIAATDTYQRLAQLGQGHFRRDDMLATGLANRAAILDHLDDPTALATAEQALRHSADVWEANLLCARVLERHDQLAAAEDAILRNLDVNLEQRLSQTFRVSLYYHSGQTQKLAQVLSDDRVVAVLPMSALIRCAALLGPLQTPSHVTQRVAASIEARPRVIFGRDDVLVQASPAWQLHLASASLECGGQLVASAEPHLSSQQHQLRFALEDDWGNPWSSRRLPEIALVLTYPDQTTIRMTFGESTYANSGLRPTAMMGNSPALRLATIDVGETRLAIHSAAYGPQLEALPRSENPDKTGT